MNIFDGRNGMNNPCSILHKEEKLEFWKIDWETMELLPVAGDKSLNEGVRAATREGDK